MGGGGATLVNPEAGHQAKGDYSQALIFNVSLLGFGLTWDTLPLSPSLFLPSGMDIYIPYTCPTSVA